MAVENNASANYTEYTINVTHQSDEGLCVSPIAGPYPQRMSVVRLCAAWEFVTVYWTATREGAPPVLPAATSLDANPNRIFLGGARSGVVSPTLGGHVYSCSGVFVWAISQAEGLDSNFYLSMFPWETSFNTGGMSMVDFRIPKENFIVNLINPLQFGPLSLPVDPNVLLLQSPLQGPP